ncbi:hypothetical protein BX666DRAFT_1953779 [Dichotomocladium elegans]|nr:hypothetical protein BX666DRAFT_1953779 [Dichotomocladium elegans]
MDSASGWLLVVAVAAAAAVAMLLLSVSCEKQSTSIMAPPPRIDRWEIERTGFGEERMGKKSKTRLYPSSYSIPSTRSIPLYRRPIQLYASKSHR